MCAGRRAQLPWSSGRLREHSPCRRRALGRARPDCSLLERSADSASGASRASVDHLRHPLALEDYAHELLRLEILRIQPPGLVELAQRFIVVARNLIERAKLHLGVESLRLQFDRFQEGALGQCRFTPSHVHDAEQVLQSRRLRRQSDLFYDAAQSCVALLFCKDHRCELSQRST